jgi:formylglycine-generating enzyme required for sulfatase activity
MRHEAGLCESSTRHWRGRRPKKSQDLRGLRVAVTPDDGAEIQKEMKLDLGNGVSMDLIYIPPGKFTMGGSRKAKEGEVLADTPRHEVTLTKGFYLGKTEVTQGQYQAIMNTKLEHGPDYPVDGVKPFTALQFCDDFSAKIGLEARLPTEAEWEYAARAGTDTRWFFGDDPSKLGDYAWFKDNSDGKSQPVGRKKPNPWGLYDMYGNVAEYVRDEHLEDYYAQGPKVDPAGPSLGIHSSMQYSIEVPQAGDYTLTAKVVTTNVEQSLQLAINGAETQTTIALPFTIGAWTESEPVTVTLKQGANTLHFWRDQAPQYGVAVKSFNLKPASAK